MNRVTGPDIAVQDPAAGRVHDLPVQVGMRIPARN
jgi:hypothetical protein